MNQEFLKKSVSMINLLLLLQSLILTNIAEIQSNYQHLKINHLSEESLKLLQHWGVSIDHTNSDSSIASRQFNPTPSQLSDLADTLAVIGELSDPRGVRSGQLTRARRHTLRSSVPYCGPSRLYRSMDGTCNNENQPLKGSAGQALLRITPPTYADGVFSIKTRSVDGYELPGARRVSRQATSSSDTSAVDLTGWVMQFGQFIDHDLSMTPFIHLNSSCCGQHRSPLCFNIDIPLYDPKFRSCNSSCMEFVRSVPVWDDVSSSMSQLNTRTSFLDADMLYGVGDKWARELRELDRGRLKVFAGKYLCPDVSPEMCFSKHPLEPCFRSGDLRVNEQVRLTVTHMLLMREHNRIADELHLINHSWNDETIYQTARKIVIAQLQHITYNEWLPIILGESFALAKDLFNFQNTTGYSTRYSKEIDPSISTEFSTCAFRFGHSMIQNIIVLYGGKKDNPIGYLSLRDTYFNPYHIYKGGTDRLVHHLIKQPPQNVDTNFANDIKEHLFQNEKHPCGLDLVAMNIQRGRDHAIPSYTSLRHWCGLPEVRSFVDLVGIMPLSDVIRLATVYHAVEDIDCFIGAMAEYSLPGAIVGPTFHCIITDQFLRIRWSDNFFYDLGGLRPWKLTPEQLDEIRHATWSRVLCDNVSSMKKVQPRAFLRAGGDNSYTRCDLLPSVNLTKWKINL